MANKMVTFSAGPTFRQDMSDQASKFAHTMRSVPRKALRCEIYGTVSAVVDRKHAFNILAKVFPGLTINEAYEALTILQDRLDNQ